MKSEARATNQPRGAAGQRPASSGNHPDALPHWTPSTDTETQSSAARRNPISPRYLRRLWQGAHVKDDPEHTAFSALPAFVVRTVGLTTHMGARLDLGCLSSLLYWSACNRDEGRTLTYETGEVIHLAAGEFVLSRQSIAEDLYTRFFGAVLPESSRDDEDFRRFYDQVVKSIDRLIGLNLVRRLGYAVPEKKGVLGTVWTLTGTPLDAYPSRPLPAAPVLGMAVKGHDPLLDFGEAFPAETRSNGRVVWYNCVDRLARAYRAESVRKRRMTYSEACCRLDDPARRDRPRYHDNTGYLQAISKGVTGERHMRVGAWERGQECDREAPVRVPHVVLEIDAETFDESHGVARALVATLHRLGGRGITVADSGNRSAHVRIPSGNLHDPVYRTSRDAHRILSKWADWLCDEAGVDPELVDSGVLNPLSMIRVPGSTRQLDAEHALRRPGILPLSAILVSEFSDAKTPGGGRTLTLSDALKRIRDGQYQDTVERARRSGNYREAKKALPLLTFSGHFRYRHASRMERHSGLVVIDYDNVPNVEALKRELARVPHTVAVFASPSQEGVKAVVYAGYSEGTASGVPVLASEHRALFDEVVRRYAALVPRAIPDPSGSDMARACFVSYDPDMLVCPGARPILLPMPETPTESRPGAVVRCTVLPADEMGATGAEFRHNAETRKAPFVIPEPRTVPVASDLALSLMHAADRAFGPPPWIGAGGLIDFSQAPPLGTTTGGAWGQMCDELWADGIAESQDFACADGRSFKGRTMAAFFLSAHVKRRSDDAWHEMEVWNQTKVTPPLPPFVLRNQFRRARADSFDSA